MVNVPVLYPQKTSEKPTFSPHQGLIIVTPKKDPSTKEKQPFRDVFWKGSQLKVSKNSVVNIRGEFF